MENEEPEWLTKRQASARMGIGERQVLQLAGKGKLRRRRERDPATKQHVVKVHGGDVQAYIDAAKPAVLEVMPASAALPAIRAENPQNESIAIILATLAKQALAPAPGEWMDLDRASQASGLDRQILLRLVREGKLPAFRGQPIKTGESSRAKAGSSWRVCRRDLDAIQGEIACQV